MRMRMARPGTGNSNLGRDVESRAGPRLSISRFLSHRLWCLLKPGGMGRYSFESYQQSG